MNNILLQMKKKNNCTNITSTIPNSQLKYEILQPPLILFTHKIYTAQSFPYHSFPAPPHHPQRLFYLALWFCEVITLKSARILEFDIIINADRLHYIVDEHKTLSANDFPNRTKCFKFYCIEWEREREEDKCMLEMMENGFEYVDLTNNRFHFNADN